MCAALLHTASTSAVAQSPYFLLGFGEPVLTTHARLEGMGGTGVGLADGRVVNDLNPASWSWLTRARLETSFRVDRTKSEFAGQSSMISDFKFNGLSFGAMAWDRHKLAISLGFAPLTNASYDLVQDDSLTRREYVSEGGISLANIGASFMPMPGVSIGGKLGVFFGNVRHLSSLDFNNDETVEESQFQREYAVNGLRGSFGLVLHGDSLADALGGITLGLAFSTPATLDVKRRTTSLVALKDTTVEEGGEGYYPASLGVGLTYTIDRRYRLLADFHSQDLSQAILYTQDASVGDPNLQAMTRISAGFERIPNMSSEFGAATGFSRWGLRAGAYYAITPFAPMNGGVTEMAGSIGLGIPMSAESIIDVALTVGQRGPANANTGPSDFFIRAGISLGLAERWFIPTRRDD